MTELQPFTAADFPQLVKEIPDARFLVQWTGPRYVYPLDAAQLRATLAQTVGDEPSFRAFKFVDLDASRTVGHIQLMDIDYNAKTCVLGRVLIFAAHRGMGLGKAMVRQAVRAAFEEFGLDAVALGVFDFNASAIKAYESVGFSEFEFVRGARQFRNEFWNVVRMQLKKEDWRQRLQTR